MLEFKNSVIYKLYLQVIDSFPEPPSLLTCIKLAIPAVILGIAVRLWLSIVLPDCYFGADSGSYWHAAKKLYLENEIVFNSKRRFIYPLLLIILAKVPFLAPVYSVTIVQQIVGVLSIFPFVYITRWALPKSRIAVIVASCLYTIWYKNLHFEREVIGDALMTYSIVFFTAFAARFLGNRGRRGMTMFLIFAAIAVGIKPSCKVIWLAALCFTLFLAPNPLRWKRICQVVTALGTVIFFWVGSSGQGNWLLLSSALPLVPEQGERYQPYREILRPWIIDTKAWGKEYPWHQKYYKKGLKRKNKPNVEHVRWINNKQWHALVSDREKVSNTFKGLAIEGVLAHPLRFSNFIY